jgi:hypothetical protein
MPTPEEEKAQHEAEERRKADEQRIADLANKVAADHIKRSMSKFEKMLEERDQKIAQLEARTPDKDPTPPAQRKDDLVDPRIKELEARMADRDRKLDEERKARESERAARLRDEEKSATLAALAEAEITGKLQQGALLTLQAEGKIGRDDAGNVVFLVQKDGYVDKLPVATGVKEWAEKDGAAFKAAKGVGGAGTKPAPRPTAGGKGDSRQERVQNAKRDLAAYFFGQNEQK